jgi:hypothetical protein
LLIESTVSPIVIFLDVPEAAELKDRSEKHAAAATVAAKILLTMISSLNILSRDFL